MTRLQMLIAGFGGQGVLFAGKVAAWAGLLAGQEVSWLPSYGPEMRGGTANCAVCIADAPIASPLVTEPNLFIALNAPSYARFIDQVEAGGQVFVDASLVEDIRPRGGVTTYAIPATELAIRERLEGLTSLMMLGFAAARTEALSLAHIEAALERCIPPSKAALLEADLRAVRFGAGLDLDSTA